jgi:hypothetical protein
MAVEGLKLLAKETARHPTLLLPLALFCENIISKPFQ